MANVRHEPTEEELIALKEELDRRAALCEKTTNIPANKTALIRRIVQEKGQFFDSAEYVLTKGLLNDDRSAFFNGRPFRQPWQGPIKRGDKRTSRLASSTTIPPMASGSEGSGSFTDSSEVGEAGEN